MKEPIIKIDIKGKEVELTFDEARELLNTLNFLAPQQPVYIPYQVPVENPWRIPPVITYDNGTGDVDWHKLQPITSGRCS